MPQSEPYIIAVEGQSRHQYFVVGEKQWVSESQSCIAAVLSLIAIYYVFDIAYQRLWNQYYYFFKKPYLM